MTKQANSTSKKREILHVDKNITNAKNKLATEILDVLNQYKNTYKLQIKEDATIDEVVRALEANNKDKLLEVKHSKDKEKLEANFTNLNENQVLEVLAKQSKEIIGTLMHLAMSANKKIKGSGLTIENFVLNNDFVINSKVTGRIKNIASIYCTNQKQIDLKNLATKISELIKSGLKSGLLAPNRLGVIAENIIDINTGELKHQYIMRR